VNELAVAGLAIGGVLLLSQGGGVVVGQVAGDASKAACDALRAAQPVAGVKWQVPSTNDPTGAFVQMKEAFVGAYGQLSGVAGVFPREMSTAQLVLVIDAWLDAFKAGCNASTSASQNYNLSSNPGAAWQKGGCNTSYCATATWLGDSKDSLTPLGQAVCDLSSYRDTLAGAAWAGANDSATSDQIVDTFHRVNALASEMSGADFSFPGTRESDKNWSLDDVMGGLAAAGTATASFVGGLAGDAAGAVAGAIVGSSLFWFVGLGFVGYLALRRSA